LPEKGPTRSYAFVLVPGFTLLAFSSAVEPLRIANQLSQQPLYRWRILSEDGTPVASSSGIMVGADGDLAPQDRDVRLFVCAGNPPMAAERPPVVSAVLRHHRFGGKVGGICTGVVALARAGLLEGLRFTLHWENQPGFIESFPELNPSGNRFETEAGILTCGGGVAATDMMLRVIAEDHGADFAAMVSEMCLRTVMPAGEAEQRSSLAALMSSRNPVLIATIRLMNSHIDDPLGIEKVAEAAGYSRRQLERLFKGAVGKSPGEFYRDLRLDRGRNLLVTTNLTVDEIAAECGYSSPANFTKSFRARFGIAPTRLKHGIGMQVS
jgi:transcriptional regulator GlxA family with amidase domain